MAPDEKATFFPAALSAAVQSCQCNVDVDSVKALHWWWSGRLSNNGQVYVAVRVPLTGRGNAKRAPIQADGDLPWSTAHQQILAAGAAEHHAFYVTDPGDTQAARLSRPHRAREEFGTSATDLHGENPN